MFNTYEQAQADVKGKFEGGTSFNLDWSTLFKEGARHTRAQISPATIKRRVPIYGGISIDLPIYTCPTDVHTPAALYPADNSFNGRDFKYTAAQAFMSENIDGQYTIDYVNGVPFIVAAFNIGSAFKLWSVAGNIATSGVQLTETLRNFLGGSSAKQGTFTDTLYHVAWDLETVADLSDYANGVITLPFEIADASKIEAVRFRLLSDASNYADVATTNDVIGNTFVNGWNLARFDLASRVNTGTPALSNINSCRLEIQMKTGESQFITIDDVTIHRSQAAYFEYYSTKNFRSAAGAYLDKPTNDSDVILFTEEAYDVWLYTVCGLVVQDATYDGVDSKESVRLENNKVQALQAYKQKYPSQQQPVSYNIATKM